MREIKFRGKRIDNGEWIYGYLIKQKYYNKVYICKTSGARDIVELDTKCYEVDPKTVGQYTGLKDKNGKEVYEGDIVQYKTYYAVKRWWRYSYEIPLIEQEMEKQRKDWHYEKGVIKIVDGCVKLNSLTGPNIAFGEKTEIGSTYWSDYEQKWWDFEVIGNIYENPELLEG